MVARVRQVHVTRVPVAGLSITAAKERTRWMQRTGSRVGDNPGPALPRQFYTQSRYVSFPQRIHFFNCCRATDTLIRGMKENAKSASGALILVRMHVINLGRCLRPLQREWIRARLLEARE